VGATTYRQNVEQLSRIHGLRSGGESAPLSARAARASGQWAGGSNRGSGPD